MLESSASSNRWHALRGRNVLVTGHTGFKGAWLCLWLNLLGARVTGYALAPPTCPSLFELADVHATLHKHYEGDIRNTATLRNAFDATDPDVVFHLAAQSVVTEGYRTPFETFDVNVMGTAAVLEAARRLDKACAVVCVTSDKCYENREQVWGYRECDPMGERDPYRSSRLGRHIAITRRSPAFVPGMSLAEGILPAMP
jgi:CDP-glucose 4,6-dehydratase